MDEKIVQRLLNVWLMKFYYFFKLPGAWFFGLKLSTLDQEKAVVEIQFSWATKNPFQSIYFAALSAAAELSTGSILLAASEGKNISMLVTQMQGRFIKKAKDKIRFECKDVQKILAAMEVALQNQEGATVSAMTTGINPDGVVVAEFTFEWSMRKKRA